MSIDEALKEWYSKKRRMGCVAATNWFCKRVPSFNPIRLRRYMPDGNDKNGNFFEHVVAYNNVVIIDLVPHCDTYRDGPKGPLYMK